MEILCVLVALFASVIGAISGIGGGVIMKPVLDAVSGFTPSTIGFLSGLTVLSMSSVTLLRRRKQSAKMDGKRALFLSLGGILGGIAGKALFEGVKVGAGEMTVKAVQNVALLLLTLLTLFFMLNLKKIRTHQVKHIFAHIVIGLALGIMSAFLGIGGGPFNLMALIYFYSLDNKEAAGYSLCVIWFSQVSALVTTLLGRLPSFSIVALVLMCIGGVIGGLVGNKLVKGFSKEQAARFFICVLVLIASICVYNFVTAL